MSYKTPKALRDLLSPRSCAKLFEMSKRNGTERSFSYEIDGQEITINYILLDPTSNWQVGNDTSTGQSNLGEAIQLAIEHKVTAFGCGDIHLIVPANVPEEFIPFVLFHEVTDSHSLKIAIQTSDRKLDKTDMAFARKYAHIRGCQTELCQVFYEGEETSGKYAEWLLRMNGDPKNATTYFNRAIPGFLKRADRIRKKSLDVVVDFFLAIHNYSGQTSHKNDIINHWEWIKPHIPKNPPEDRVYI